MQFTPELRTVMFRKKQWMLLFFLMSPLTLSAQEVPVPVHLQYSILLKTLSFDRNLKTRSGNAIVLGILFQDRYRLSLDIKNEMVSAANEFTRDSVEGLPIRLVPLEYADEAILEKQISGGGINALYVCPLRAVDLKTIFGLSRKNKVLTFTGVPQYVERGLSIGVVLQRGRPSLFINLRASREEGADLDSQLLNLARTIR